MNDRFDDRGRHAAAAVRNQTAGLDPDRGLDEVIRRGRRRNLAVPAATVAVVALLAVPALGWLLGGSDPLGLEVADGPTELASEGEDTLPGDPGGDDTTAAPEATGNGADDESSGEAGAGADGESAAEDATPLGTFSLDEVATEGFPDGGDGVVQLTDVRVAGHDGFDRIVFEFDGEQMSPYRVAYVEPPILQDGSGEEMEVAGTAFLELRLTAASGVEFDDDAADGYRLTYEGPERVIGDTSSVAEVVRTGDFEATLSWAVGLDERAPFSVTVLESPLRLVIDVQTS